MSWSILPIRVFFHLWTKLIWLFALAFAPILHTLIFSALERFQGLQYRCGSSLVRYFCFLFQQDTSPVNSDWLLVG